MERQGWLALEADSNSDTHGCTGTYQQRYTSHITSPAITVVLPQYDQDALNRIFNTPQTAIRCGGN